MTLQIGNLLPARADAALLNDINGERFRMLLSMTAPGIVVGGIFAVVAALFFKNRVSADVVLLWLGIKLGIAGIRLVHCRWQVRRHDLFPDRVWQIQSLVLLVLDALVWGAAGLAVLASSETTALLLGTALAGVATMATFTLQADLLFAAACCLPMLAPAAFSLLAHQNSFGIYGGAALILVAICLLAVGWLAQRRILDLLYFRFVSARLAREREAALQIAHQQMAEKSQFVATMSHELRTPLHGILGLTRMLRSARMDSIDQSRLALVERSGEHLLTVINNILDFSKIEAGHLSTDCQAFDLRALLNDLVALTSVAAHNKGIKLTTDFQLPEPCWVMGDAARLRQILLNLIGNAVKFTDKGGVRVCAFRRPSRSDDHGAVVLRVDDSGIGIAPADLAQIFSPFKQAEGSTQHRYDGTGLGLTISRAMALAMKGDITCSSILGKGSTFELQLPLPPADVAVSTQPGFGGAEARPISETTHHTPALQGHVLLAEDNDVNAMIVEALLRKHGLSVEHFPDGHDVVGALRQSRARPDLVLMDCLMPTLDGFEATRLIRADERARGLGRVPIIALTANALSEDADRCLAAGMDAYLAKPFNEDQLVDLLTAYLGVKHSQPSFEPLQALTPA